MKYTVKFTVKKITVEAENIEQAQEIAWDEVIDNAGSLVSVISTLEKH